MHQVNCILNCVYNLMILKKKVHLIRIPLIHIILSTFIYFLFISLINYVIIIFFFGEKKTEKRTYFLETKKQKFKEKKSLEGMKSYNKINQLETK